MTKTQIVLPNEAVLNKIAELQKRHADQARALSGAIVALEPAYPDRAREMRRELEKLKVMDGRLLGLDEKYRVLSDSYGEGLRRISQVHDDHPSQAGVKEAAPSSKTSEFDRRLYHRTLNEAQYWQGIFHEEHETPIVAPENPLDLIPAEKLRQTVALLTTQPDYPTVQTLQELRRAPGANAELLAKANTHLASLSHKFGAPAEESLLRLQPATVIAIADRLSALESKSREGKLLEMLYLLRGFMPNFDGLSHADQTTLRYLRGMDDDALDRHSRSIKEATEVNYLRILEKGYGEKFDANPRIEGLDKAPPLARIVVQIVLIENEKGHIEEAYAPVAATYNEQVIRAIRDLPAEIRAMFANEIGWLHRFHKTWSENGQFTAKMRGIMHSIVTKIGLALSHSSAGATGQIENGAPMFALTEPSTPE